MAKSKKQLPKADKAEALDEVLIVAETQQPKADKVEIEGISSPLKEGVKYLYPVKSAEVLVSKGIAKYI